MSAPEFGAGATAPTPQSTAPSRALELPWPESAQACAGLSRRPHDAQAHRHGQGSQTGSAMSGEAVHLPAHAPRWLAGRHAIGCLAASPATRSAIRDERSGKVFGSARTFAHGCQF